MMTSKSDIYDHAYVWIWLPGETEPVVAGKLTLENEMLVFNYGKSYLERPDKIAIYDNELPLQSGIIQPLAGLTMPGCIRDGSPDAWGRRVLINKKLASLTNKVGDIQLDELTYLLESGSDRIGALDFQLSPTDYQPRTTKNVSLEELMKSAERVEKGVPLTHELDLALYYGSSIGGARPKALIESDGKKYIAKFSSTTDVYNVIKAEFIAMRLAKMSGIHVAEVSLTKASHKDILLIERFDRVHSKNGWERKSILSALTLFELDEMMARYGSYENLAEFIRYRFDDTAATLKELFQRMTFNILVGNTDDHARNHAAFWDGHMLSLTPAYDICPQSRSGNIATQAMLITKEDNKSQIASCLDAAPNFLLKRNEAIHLIENQITSIIKNWDAVCEISKIHQVDKKLLASRQFLNLYAFENLSTDAAHIVDLVLKFKTKI